MVDKLATDAESVERAKAALTASERTYGRKLDLLAACKNELAQSLDGRQVITQVLQLVTETTRIGELSISAGQPQDPIDSYRRLASVYFSGAISLNYCRDNSHDRYRAEKAIFLEGFRINNQKVVDIITQRAITTAAGSTPQQ